MSSSFFKKTVIVSSVFLTGFTAPFVYAQTPTVGVPELNTPVNSGVTHTLSVKYGDKSVEKYTVPDGQNVAAFMKDHNLPVGDFQTVSKHVVSPDLTVNTDFTLEHRVYESKITTIDIPLITEEHYDDTMDSGQIKVVDPGQPGLALVTKITRPEVSKESKVIQNETESISIVKPMRPKVIIVGTKQGFTDGQDVGRQASIKAGGSGDYVAHISASQQALLQSIPDATPEIELLKKQLGKPYIWAHSGPNSFDCSGLVYYVYHILNGYNIPRTAWEQGRSGIQVSRADMRPGDVIYSPHHITVYVGGGKVIHASRPGVGVVIGDANYFLNHGFRIARLIPPQSRIDAEKARQAQAKAQAEALAQATKQATQGQTSAEPTKDTSKAKKAATSPSSKADKATKANKADKVNDDATNNDNKPANDFEKKLLGEK